MRQANHLQISRGLSACGHNIMMSEHALERTIERSELSASRVRELIASREAVVLPYRSGNRSYQLIFDTVNRAFLVGVVAIDGRGPAGASASIVTVLTRHQFETDAGPLSTRALRTAAARALNEVDLRKWEHEEFGGEKVPRKYRLITYFRKEDGSVGHTVFRNPPLCDHFVDEHSLSEAAGHPDFWSWYARRAVGAKLPIEWVLSVQIADTDKTTLNINAKQRECACCARCAPR